MMLTIEHLNTGILWWKESTKWSKDFHFEDYIRMNEDLKNGISDEWWQRTLNRLCLWHAFRGPKPPNARAEIESRGQSILSQISTEYQKLNNHFPKISIDSLDWDDIFPLFEKVSCIKQSFVFASKMCHFIFPNVFILMDNTATSVSEYEIYWTGMRERWLQFEEKKEAYSIMEKAIESQMKVYDLFPFKTKIIELCHIGSKHGGDNGRSEWKKN